MTDEVGAELAGETIVIWWGLFDHELLVEHGDERMGPFHLVGGAIPLHRYRKHRQEVRADQVAALAGTLALPRAALSGENAVVMTGVPREVDVAAILGAGRRAVAAVSGAVGSSGSRGG